MRAFKSSLVVGLSSCILLCATMSTAALAGKPRRLYEIEAEKREWELKAQYASSLS